MPDGDAEHYRGICRLQVERFTQVCFIPRFSRPEGAPPPFPAAIASADDARAETALQARRSVTPDERGPGVRVLQTDPARRVLFLVRPAEYAVFDRELEALAGERTGVHAWPASEVSGLAVVRYLLETVSPAPA